MERIRKGRNTIILLFAILFMAMFTVRAEGEKDNGIPEYFDFVSASIFNSDGGQFTTNNPVEDSALLLVNYRFSIDQYSIPEVIEGETTDFQIIIPDDITLPNTIGPNDLVIQTVKNNNPESITIGKWTAGRDGVLYISLDNTQIASLKELNGMEGYIQFGGKFYAMEEIDGNEVTIPFPGVNDVILPYHKEIITTPLKADKTGSYNESDKTITWNIEVDGKDLGGAVIQDTLVANVQRNNLTITDDGFTLKDESGNKIVGGNSSITTRAGDDSWQESFTYTFPEGLTGERYVLSYTTTVNNPYYFYGGSLRNSATVQKGDEISPEASDTVSVPKNPEIVKGQGTITEDAENSKYRIVTYSVVVNQNNLNLQGAKVIDQLPKGAEFIENSVKPEAVLSGPAVLSGDLATGKKVTFPLGNISEQKTFSYQVKIPVDGSYSYNMSNDGTAYVVRNTATVVTDDGFSQSDYEDVSLKHGKIILTKNGSLDYKANTITWTVVMELPTDGDVVFSDEIKTNEQQVYIPDSLTLNGVAQNDTEWYSNTNGKAQLSYTFYAKGKYTIQYKTRITYVDLTRKNGNYVRYNNIASVNSGEDTINRSAYVDVYVGSLMKKECTDYDYSSKQYTWKLSANERFASDGKDVAFNGVKQETTGSQTQAWTTITDILPIDHEYVTGTLKYIAEDGITVNNISVPAYSSSMGDGTGESTTLSDGHTVRVWLTKAKDIASLKTTDDPKSTSTTQFYKERYAIVISYNPTLDGPLHFELQTKNSTGIYENFVQNDYLFRNNFFASHAVFGPDNTIHYSAYQSLPMRDYLDKESVYEEGSQDITYNVTMNQSLSTIPEGAKLTDMLPNGLALVESSVKLYETMVDKDTGELSKGTEVDYDHTCINYDTTTNEFTFTMPTTTYGNGKAYILSFKVKGYGLYGQNVTNAVSFEGNGLEEQTAISNPIKFSYSEGESGIIGTMSTSAEITKKDNITGAALAGAEFTLYVKSGSDYKAVMIYGKELTAITDENGKALFEHWINEKNEYKIVETKPPVGYEKCEDIVIPAEAHSEKLTYDRVDDRKSGMVLVEKNAKSGDTLLDSKLVEGCKFELYRQVGEEINQSEDVKISSGADDTYFEAVYQEDSKKSMINLGNLAWGKYYLKEMEASSGFEVLSEPVSFEVVVKEDGTVAIDQELVITNSLKKGPEIVVPPSNPTPSPSPNPVPAPTPTKTPAKTPTSKGPKTGDEENVNLYLILMSLSAIVFVAGMTVRYKKRKL